MHRCKCFVLVTSVACILVACLMTYYQFRVAEHCGHVMTTEERAICIMESLPHKPIECPKNFSLYQFTDGEDVFDIQVHTEKHKQEVIRCEVTPLSYFARQFHWSWKSYDPINHTQAMVIRDVCLAVDYIHTSMAEDGEESVEEEHEDGVVIKVEDAGDGFLSENTQEITVEDVADEGDRSALSSILSGIYPGTLWCGFGNIAEDIYSKLGKHASADACCQAHDICKPIIESFRTKYHHSNPSVFPVSHCSCDIELYNCFKESGTVAAKEIGRLFFNLARMKCFDFEVRDVCLESHFGVCTRSESKCAAVIKNNRHF